MRSKHADYFNHDSDASAYDSDVMNESNPIRAGYAALLRWVGEEARDLTTVIDLGCGTGNTAEQLKDATLLVCVDVSSKMTAIAKNKLLRNGLEFYQADILEFIHSWAVPVDGIVSTYAIHHLMQAEKHLLFEKVKGLLKPRGKLIFGDLMFENDNGERQMSERYPDHVEEWGDEFFWNLEQESSALDALGLHVSTKRFSDLTWGVSAVN